MGQDIDLREEFLRRGVVFEVTATNITPILIDRNINMGNQEVYSSYLPTYVAKAVKAGMRRWWRRGIDTYFLAVDKGRRRPLKLGELNKVIGYILGSTSIASRYSVDVEIEDVNICSHLDCFRVSRTSIESRYPWLKYLVENYPRGGRREGDGYRGDKLLIPRIFLETRRKDLGEYPHIDAGGIRVKIRLLKPYKPFSREGGLEVDPKVDELIDELMVESLVQSLYVEGIGRCKTRGFGRLKPLGYSELGVEKLINRFREGFSRLMETSFREWIVRRSRMDALSITYIDSRERAKYGYLNENLENIHVYKLDGWWEEDLKRLLWIIGVSTMKATWKLYRYGYLRGYRDTREDKGVHKILRRRGGGFPTWILGLPRAGKNTGYVPHNLRRESPIKFAIEEGGEGYTLKLIVYKTLLDWMYLLMNKNQGLRHKWERRGAKSNRRGSNLVADLKIDGMDHLQDEVEMVCEYVVETLLGILKSRS